MGRSLSRRKVGALKDLLNSSPTLVERIIIAHGYEGIRDQDGWETLELTVRDTHNRQWSDYILKRLQQLQAQKRYL